MTTNSRSQTPSSLLSLSLYPNPQTQQPPHPFFPQHTPRNNKFKIFFFFFYLLSFSLLRCPQNPDVCMSVCSVLSVTPSSPRQFKIQEKKKPGIFNLNQTNPKLDPTLCYSNSSTSRYPRTKFSKEKKTHPCVRHPLTISQVPTHPPTHPQNPKELIFANLRAFVSLICSRFLCCSGKQGRKEVIRTREEDNTHHSSKDSKSFVCVPKPITTKPTDRENNSSEHRPIKRFMGLSKRKKTYLDCYASEVVFKLIDARENSARNSGPARRRRRPTTQDAKPRYAAAQSRSGSIRAAPTPRSFTR